MVGPLLQPLPGRIWNSYGSERLTSEQINKRDDDTFILMGMSWFSVFGLGAVGPTVMLLTEASASVWAGFGIAIGCCGGVALVITLIAIVIFSSISSINNSPLYTGDQYADYSLESIYKTLPKLIKEGHFTHGALRHFEEAYRTRYLVEKQANDTARQEIQATFNQNDRTLENNKTGLKRDIAAMQENPPLDIGIQLPNRIRALEAINEQQRVNREARDNALNLLDQQLAALKRTIIEGTRQIHTNGEPDVRALLIAARRVAG